MNDFNWPEYGCVIEITNFSQIGLLSKQIKTNKYIYDNLFPY